MSDASSKPSLRWYAAPLIQAKDYSVQELFKARHLPGLWLELVRTDLELLPLSLSVRFPAC